MLFGNHNALMISILIASFLILILGIFDDIKPIPAKYKFIVHILVACIIVFYGGLKLTNATMFSFKVDFGFMASPVTILIIVSILCTGVYTYLYLNIRSLETTTVSARIIRLYRDIARSNFYVYLLCVYLL